MINISPSSSLPKREEGVPGRVVSNHFLFRPIPCLCIFPCMWEPYCKILFLFRPEISTEAKGQKLLFLPRKIPSSDPKTQSPIVFKGRKKRGSPIDTRFFLENTDIPGELLSFPPSLSHLPSPLPPQTWPMWAKGSCQKVKFSPPLLRNRLGAKKGGKKKNRGGHHGRRKSTSTSSSNDSASKKIRRFLSCPFFLFGVCHQLKKSRITMSDRQKSVISILPLLGGGRFPLLLYLRAHP